MQKDDLIRLRHMLEAAKEIDGFLAGRVREDLDSDRMLLLSIVKDLEIIGEAASRLSEESKKEIPDIPWPDIVNTRHRLIHAYYDIDVEIIWSTVQADLPQLIVDLGKYLKDKNI
jgi:uncharacterized protein with HEPN domain